MVRDRSGSDLRARVEALAAEGWDAQRIADACRVSVARVGELLPRSAPKPRGFAAMPPELRSQISRMGGRAAHRAGTAHEFTKAEARVAGSKGGTASAKNRAARRETP